MISSHLSELILNFFCMDNWTYLNQSFDHSIKRTTLAERGQCCKRGRWSSPRRADSQPHWHRTPAYIVCSSNNNISFFLRLFFYLVTFVTYSVTTVIRCLESIGQAVVRVQAGHFEWLCIIVTWQGKIDFKNDITQMNSSLNLLDWKIVAIETLVIATGLPAWWGERGKIQDMPTHYFLFQPELSQSES